MEESGKLAKSEYCLGCLCSSEKCNLRYFNVNNETLKTIFQVDYLSLCYICKRMAQHVEFFIQNVQSNQILLENINFINKSTLQSASMQTRPFVTLSHSTTQNTFLEITEEQNSEESFKVIFSSKDKDVKIKEELKEEESETEHLEAEFIEDESDFQESYVKEEEKLSLKELLKTELKIEGIELKCLKKTLKKDKVKKKKRQYGRVNLDSDKIEIIFITREQCMEERGKMAQDKKYLNAPFKCEDCIKGFSFKGSYEKHLEKHCESTGIYICDVCKQRTSTEEKLISHKRYHEVRYKCKECDLVRISRLTIQDHYAAKHCDLYFSCPHCSKSFKRQVSLRKHISYLHTHKERVSCAYCHKTYCSKDTLKAHMVVQHPKEVSAGEVSKRHVCSDCGKAFRAPSLLKMHSLKHSHSREYYCVECDKSFKSAAVLKQHLKTALPHINYIELPLPCLHCEKRFAIRRDLERHTNRVHLNIRPFQCDRCNKAYVNGWSLNEHKRLVHEGYKRPLKYPCPMCDKVFDRNQILKGHIRTHTGERPFQCSKCPAKFSQASILGTHVKLIHLKLTRDGRPKTVAMK